MFLTRPLGETWIAHRLLVETCSSLSFIAQMAQMSPSGMAGNLGAENRVPKIRNRIIAETSLRYIAELIAFNTR